MNAARDFFRVRGGAANAPGCKPGPTGHAGSSPAELINTSAAAPCAAFTPSPFYVAPCGVARAQAAIFFGVGQGGQGTDATQDRAGLPTGDLEAKRRMAGLPAVPRGAAGFFVRGAA
jgi:hypothetical protein